MTLAFGRAYGGSTVVYTGTSLTLPRRWSRAGACPGSTTATSAAARRSTSARTTSTCSNRTRSTTTTACSPRGAGTLGYRVEQFPINVNGCHGSGLCNLGCPNAAKQGTNRVQLPAAEAAGVEVVTNCKVEAIGERECTATVANPSFGEPSSWEPGRYRIRARAIVVAGGAVNSPALLLRSRLPVRLPALGRYLTTHPAHILVGEHERPITNYDGHPKSYYCDHFATDDGFLLETCMYFPFTTAKNLIGFGAAHSALMSRMDRMQMILVLAVDPAVPDNRVTVDRDGEPVVDYRLTARMIDAMVRLARAAARIFFAAGCRRVHAPAGGELLHRGGRRRASTS